MTRSDLSGPLCTGVGCRHADHDVTADPPDFEHRADCECSTCERQRREFRTNEIPEVTK